MDQSLERYRATGVQLSLVRLLSAHWVKILLGTVVLLAIFSRFWELGVRALHHDESLHALYSFRLYNEGEYQHNPMMHGPILFHLTALGYWILGASDFASRVVPAILGAILVWTPWKFRDWIGTTGALVASTLLLISPTLLYYSRFIREDIFVVMWTVLIAYGLWKYLEGGEDFHLYLMVAGWSLLFSQKVFSFLLAAGFWSFLLILFLLRYTGRLGPKIKPRASREWHLLVLLGALLLPHASAVIVEALGWVPEAGYAASVYQDPDFIWRAGIVILLLFGIGVGVAATLWDLRKFLVATGIFYFIFVLFHTTFLTWPWGIGSGMVGTLGYWIEQHDVQRGGQPWYYYVMLLSLYEYLPLLLGLAGGGILLVRGRSGGETLLDRKREHLDTRALWPLFNLWWFLWIFAILSYAGEKMPWLLSHIALPLILLAGWAMGRFLDRIDWTALRPPRALLAVLLGGVAFVAAMSILWLAIPARWPFQGTDMESLRTTGQWVISLGLLAGAGWGLMRIRGSLGRRATGQMVILAVTVLLALASVRFAVIASFINGDVPNEPLIYTQTAPHVKRVMGEIEMISKRLTGGKELKIAHDNSTLWPFEWYLRDYPNKGYYANNPDNHSEMLQEASVILVGLDNEELVKPYVSGWIRHHYPMRWWFPENYKQLADMEVVKPDPENPAQSITTTESRPFNLINLFGNLAERAEPEQARADFLHFLWNRELRRPIASYDFVVYIRPEIAKDVWQYGLTVAATDPSYLHDPYAEATTEMPAATVIDQPDLFNNPKDVALLPNGNLVVADSGNHRIVILSPEGAVLNTFGGQGTEPGKFNEPWGVATGPDGTIYVADTWNHRVQRLDQQGEVLATWGKSASTGGELGEPSVFWGPRDIVVGDDGRVLVVDTGNKRIQVFDAEGNFLDQFGGVGAAPGLLAEPVGIALAPDNTIWVADTWNRRVQRFGPGYNAQDQFSVRAWAGESIANKPYVEVSADRIWFSDPEGYRIVEMNRAGEILRVWGGYGSGESELDLPYGLSFDGERLWVVDSQNNRLVAYDVN